MHLNGDIWACDGCNHVEFPSYSCLRDGGACQGIDCAEWRSGPCVFAWRDTILRDGKPEAKGE
jgi:hypothetical protein